MNNEWISVDERLPEDSKPVLTFQQNDQHPEYTITVLGLFEGVFMDYEDIEEGRTNSFYPYITHWMPLPPPPKK